MNDLLSTNQIPEPQDENSKELEITNEITINDELSTSETNIVSENDDMSTPELIQTEEVHSIENNISPESISEEVKAVDDITEDIISEEVKVDDITQEIISEEINELVVEEAEVKEHVVDDIQALVNEIEVSHEHEEIEEIEDIIEDIGAFEERIVTMSREDIVSALDEVVRENDIMTMKARVSIIKVAFLKKSKEERQIKIDSFVAEGGKKEEFELLPDSFENRFNAAFGIFKEKKNRFNEELENQKLENLNLKKQLLDEIKELVSSEESLKVTHDKFKDIQDRWKQIGQVPREEIQNLWQTYNFYAEKFFDKVRMNKELKDLDLKKNLEKKLEICEKVEELLLEQSPAKTFKLLQKYHEEWRELGPVPMDKKEEIWERLKIATDKINATRKEHYDSIKEEQDNNFIAKTILCEKAAALLETEATSVKEWQDKSDYISDLLKSWKSIGPAQKKLNDEIWEKFKTILDTFFDNQKEYYSKIKQEQVDNYNQKINLCLQAESIVNRIDWRNATSDILNLQIEWKKIGPVPRKLSDKVWKRFRTACDEFFKGKDNYFKNINQIEDDNLNKKRDIINRIKEFKFSGNKSENLEVLKTIQREWTEVGYVPMKEKENIYKEYRDVLNKRFEELKINASEIDLNEYKHKVENLKADPHSYNIISKEKTSVSNNLKQLKEDINIWENNIGFFANSKNANLLRLEFEKKISKAKEEVKILEDKIKMLNNK